MKKSIIAMLLAALMLVSLLAGCGSAAPAAPAEPSAPSSPAAPAQPSEPSAPAEPAKDDGKVYELSLSTHDPVTSNKTIYFQNWADEIEEASGGRIKITVYSGGSLAAGTAALDALRTQVCDIAWIYPQYFAGQFPLSEVISLPIGLSCVPQSVQTLYALYDKYPELQEEVSEFVPLMMHSNPMNKVCSADKVITSVADMKGLTYRAATGTPSDLLLAWGATPIQLAPGDIYQAVQKGTVQGFIFDWSGMVSFGLQEVCHYLVTYPVFCGPYYLMMNKDSFNALPADLQQIILDHSGIEASMGLAWIYEYDENRGYEACIAAGCEAIELTPEQEAEFRSYGDGAIQNWKDNWGDRLADADAYVNDAIAFAAENAIDSATVKDTIANLDMTGYNA